MACILAASYSMAQTAREITKQPLKLLTSIEHYWEYTNGNESRSLGLNATVLLNKRLSVGLQGGRSYWLQPYVGHYYSYRTSRLGATCGFSAVSRTENWLIPNVFIGRTHIAGTFDVDGFNPKNIYPDKIKLPHNTLGLGLNYYHLFSKNEKGALLGFHARYNFSPKETQWVWADRESFPEQIMLGAVRPSTPERLNQFSVGVSLGFGTRIQRNKL